MEPWIEREAFRCFWGAKFDTNWKNNRWVLQRSVTSDIDPSDHSNDRDSDYNSANRQ